MTIFNIIEENVFQLLDEEFRNDGEYTRINSGIQKLENENGGLLGQLVSDGSAFSQYVELLNQQTARAAELAYRKGLVDMVDFIIEK